MNEWVTGTGCVSQGLGLWCRRREQELSSIHHAEVEGLASQYSQQTQLMLANFNKAKKVMTAEMAHLQRR